VPLHIDFQSRGFDLNTASSDRFGKCSGLSLKISFQGIERANQCAQMIENSQRKPF